MANAMYGPGKDHVMGKYPQVNLLTDDIYVTLLSAGYTFNALHEFYNVVEPYAVGAPSRVRNPVLLNGKWTCDAVTFRALSGAAVTQFVIWRSSGASSASVLLSRYDDVSGLVYSPTGNDAVLSLDPSSGVFTWLG